MQQDIVKKNYEKEKYHSDSEYRRRRLEKTRKYQKTHKDQVNKKNRKYYSLHPNKAREYGLKYYAENYERINFQRKEKRDAITQEIYQLLGNKCSKCGYVGVALQIDHLNGGGAKRKRELNSKYYQEILEEIKNGSSEYQLLCATHNIEKKFANHEGVGLKQDLCKKCYLCCKKCKEESKTLI